MGNDWTGTCSTGTSQSPIDLPVSLFEDSGSISTNNTLHGTDIEDRLLYSEYLDFYGSYAALTNVTLRDDNLTTILASVSDGSMAFVDQNDDI